MATATIQALSIRQAADYQGVSTDTIRRWIASGDLPAWRLGPKLIRIDRADLDALRQPLGPDEAAELVPAVSRRAGGEA